MAQVLPSFLSGSSLLIRLGNFQLAYASGLTFTEDVGTGSIGGIGSYSYDAIEPLQYAARGSLSITRYTKEALNAVPNNLPGRVNSERDFIQDGNSLLTPSSFSPIGLLLSRTFDIDVYERQSPTSLQSKLIFSLKDCRLTSYSMAFTPGSLVGENIGFICIRIEDAVAELSSDAKTPSGS